MGAYVNHKMGKEIWLIANAKEVSSILWENVPEGYLPVVLVDNGPFTAAGIGYTKEELEAFTSPFDLRAKRFFIAPIEKLLEVSPELKGYMEMAARGKGMFGHDMEV